MTGQQSIKEWTDYPLSFFCKKRVGSQSTQFVLLLPSHFRQATCKCSRRPHLLRQKLKNTVLNTPLMRLQNPMFQLKSQMMYVKQL